MRTYEDVKATLTRYRQELEEEAKVKSHYVVVSGNMCITKKGASTQYILGKGDPVPMIKPTAEKNLEKQQAKVTDDVKLEVVSYYDWLTDNIKECEKLCDCMEQSLSGDVKPVKPSAEMVFVQEEPIIKGEGIDRPISASCPTCPLGINKCIACRYCLGIDINTTPWVVNCGYGEK